MVQQRAQAPGRHQHRRTHALGQQGGAALRQRALVLFACVLGATAPSPVPSPPGTMKQWAPMTSAVDKAVADLEDEQATDVRRAVAPALLLRRGASPEAVTRHGAAIARRLEDGGEDMCATVGALGSPAEPSSTALPTQPSLADPNTLACVLANSRSQFGEDLLLLPTLLLLAAGRPGTFVELGAYNGVDLSNTIMLERCFGWSGLLIEANPTNFEALKASARRAALVHAAVCDHSGFRNITARGGAVAGSVSTFSRQHQRHFGRVNQAAMTVPVPCRPLPSLMSQAGQDRATFLSLDVEGAEAAVLETANPACFDLIAVEADGADRAKDARTAQLITARSPLRPSRRLRMWLSQVYSTPPRRAAAAAADALAACAVHASRAEAAEDHMLLPSLLRAAGVAPGTFVELVGRSRFSTTAVLEECLGWRGLVVWPTGMKGRHAAERHATARGPNVTVTHVDLCGAQRTTKCRTLAEVVQASGMRSVDFLSVNDARMEPSVLFDAFGAGPAAAKEAMPQIKVLMFAGRTKHIATARRLGMDYIPRLRLAAGNTRVYMSPGPWRPLHA